VIAEPPLEAGAVHDTVTCALPDAPVTAVGNPGTVAGVTEAEAAEGAPVPAELVAVAEKVYAVPLARPVTTQDKGPVVHKHVAPPGEAVTV